MEIDLSKLEAELVRLQSALKQSLEREQELQALVRGYGPNRIGVDSADGDSILGSIGAPTSGRL